MAQIPAGIARVPNLLISQVALSNLTRTNLDLFQVQTQLSTNREVNKFSDDAVKAAGIAILDDRLSRSEQRTRNLTHADAALGVLDSALGEVYDLALEAKDIASAQVNSLSSASERAGQATVVDQLLRGLFAMSNRQGVAGFVFGGSTPGRAPVEELGGGFRYVGTGAGLITDIGFADNIPITIGANAAVGDVSTRVRGAADLNPALRMGTRLSEVNGARGLGIAPGAIQFSFNGGANVSVDLTGLDSIQQVADALTGAIRAYETTNSVTVLGAGGIDVNGGGLSIDVAAGGSLVFSDIASGTTAEDLGLTFVPFTPLSPNGMDLNPKLTWNSPISTLATAGALGSIRVNNLGRSAVIDLSGATTLEDVKNAIETANLGLRVEINAAGTGIDVLNETAAGKASAFSIEEVAGSNTTATRLGIRTFALTTALADFNDGRGVQVVDGKTNPLTGALDPALNSDFSITLGNTPPLTITIDLAPSDLTDVGTLLARINAQADAQLVAAGLAATDFQAALGSDTNGIRFTQNAAFANPMTVNKLNNSPAAEQLGLLSGTYNAGTSTYAGKDTAQVRVNNLFTALIDLRDSLLNNDTLGITIAGEQMDKIIGRIAETRGTVGGFAQRVDFAQKVEEDRKLVDTQTRSELADLDFTAAASRFALLQTQLQAGLQSTAALSRQTLLDFLS